MQKLSPSGDQLFVAVIKSGFPVFIVHQQRVADGGHMCTDLMGLSGDQLHLKISHIGKDLKWIKACLNIRTVINRLVNNTYPVCFFVLDKISL